MELDQLWTYGLQEKWVSTGSYYKEENYGRFPPFEYFCKFVCYEAKKQNYPIFMYQTSTTTHTKPPRSMSSYINPNKPISVHKTHVAITNEDPNKTCPLHNKPHPLKRCSVSKQNP